MSTTPQTDVTQAALDGIRVENQSHIARLQSQGIAVNFPMAPSVLLEMLIEAVVGPQDSPEYIAFAHAYEVKIQAMLKGIDSQVARAKLTAPGPVPNGVPRELR